MKRTNESGRSMVEMLGVLAIIGVLSIGGIAGYTTAMNRYRANEVVDIANKYATIVYSGVQTFKAMNATTSTDGYTAPALCKTGLVAEKTVDDEKKCEINGATIATPTSFPDDGVQLEITFGTSSVCKAAGSSVGATCTGTDSTVLTYTFKQS